jgi:virginiamycin A acetyltransferase
MLKKLLRRYLPSPVQSAYGHARRRLAVKTQRFLRHADVWKPDPRVTIGKYTYGIERSTIPILTARTRICVGKYCSIAPGVVFVVGRHRIESVSSYPFKAFFVEGGKPDNELPPNESITIGNDVWIGSRSLIVASVTIGHGAVVAAGAVVVEDVPPYAIVGGVPAKIIKMRFDADTARELLALAWWDWREEQIRDNLDLFYATPEKFLQAYRLRQPSTEIE